MASWRQATHSERIWLPLVPLQAAADEAAGADDEGSTANGNNQQNGSSAGGAAPAVAGGAAAAGAGGSKKQRKEKKKLQAIESSVEVAACPHVPSRALACARVRSRGCARVGVLQMASLAACGSLCATDGR